MNPHLCTSGGVLVMEIILLFLRSTNIDWSYLDNWSGVAIWPPNIIIWISSHIKRRPYFFRAALWSILHLASFVPPKFSASKGEGVAYGHLTCLGKKRWPSGFWHVNPLCFMPWGQPLTEGPGHNPHGRGTHEAQGEDLLTGKPALFGRAGVPQSQMPI